MKIVANFNEQKTNLYSRRNFASSPCFIKPLPDDCFCKKSEINFMGIEHARGLLSRYPKFSVIDYKGLKPKEKEILRREIPEIRKYLKANPCYEYNDFKNYGFSESLNSSLSTARLFKFGLDNLYGANQYTFISIGRSGGMLAKALEALGVESKILPVSGVRYLGKIVDIIDYLDPSDIKNYNAYLAKKGLDRTLIANSTKKYLFYDFTMNGTTLKKVGKFLKNPAIGLDLQNVEFRSINNDIIDFSSKLPLDVLYNDFGLTPSMKEDIIFRYKVSAYKKIDLCPSVYYKDLGKTHLYSNDKQKFDEKLLMFHLCDEIYGQH